MHIFRHLSDPHNHSCCSTDASLQFWQCQSFWPKMTFECIFKQVAWYQPWHNEDYTMVSVLFAVLHTQYTLTVVCLKFSLHNVGSILNCIFPLQKHWMNSALIRPSWNWQFSSLILKHSAYANPIVRNMAKNWPSFHLDCITILSYVIY